MPIVVRPIASGNVMPSRDRPDPGQPAAQAARPESRRVGGGQGEVARSSRDGGRGDGGRHGDELGKEVGARVAGRERGLGAGPFGGAQVGVAGRERGHPRGIVARVLVGGGRRDSVRSCPRQTTSRAGRFPCGRRSTRRIIAPVAGGRRSGGPRTARRRPRSSPTDTTGVIDEVRAAWASTLRRLSGPVTPVDERRDRSRSLPRGGRSLLDRRRGRAHDCGTRLGAAVSEQAGQAQRREPDRERPGHARRARNRCADHQARQPRERSRSASLGPQRVVARTCRERRQRQRGREGHEVGVQPAALVAEPQDRRQATAAVDRLGDAQRIVARVADRPASGRLSHGRAPSARRGHRAGPGARDGSGT